MKKRLFIDRPEVGLRGQYTFFRDNFYSFFRSDGLPARFDEFTDKDLYTTVLTDTTNDYLVNHKLQFLHSCQLFSIALLVQFLL